MPYFIIYIYCLLLGGSIFIGNISIRVIATCLMAGYLLFNRKKLDSAIRIDKSYVLIYILFSALMGCALVINGEFDEYEFIKKFFAYNFVSIIAYLAIDRFILNLHKFNLFIIYLLLLILVDDVVTILQYLKNPIGWSIGFIFNDIEKFADTAETHDSVLGMSITPGMFGHVVNNAFYIAMVAPLCFTIYRNKRRLFFNVTVFILSLIAVYMTQQRMSFYIMILSLCVFGLITLKKRPFVLFSILLVCIVASLSFGDYPNDIDYGRLTQAEDTNRIRLAGDALRFISDHPLWGGPISFQKQAGISAHNIILDSYIFSGLLGFIVMMALFVKTTSKSVSRMLMGFKTKENNNIILFTAYSLFGCMIYGLTHNSSFLTGEVMVFILLALLLKSEKITGKTSYD